MKMNVDLGMKGFGSIAPMKVSEPDDVCYPEFHYCGDSELELPDEGVMEIKFRKVSEEERVDREGNKRFSCTVEVRKILKVDGEDVKAPATSGEGGKTEAALDKILSALKSDSHDREDGYDE